MPQITLDLSDAAELAEMLTFLAGWLSGSQKPCARTRDHPEGFHDEVLSDHITRNREAVPMWLRSIVRT